MKKFFRGALIAFSGIVLGVKITEAILSKPLRRIQEDAIKFQVLFQMMGKWLQLKQRGIGLSDFFVEKGYKRIAIYGIGLAGQILYEELRDANLQIAYGIDKNGDSILSDMKVYTPEDLLPDVDVIVVSAVTYYEEISNMLRKKTDCAILSLEDLIYEISEGSAG